MAIIKSKINEKRVNLLDVIPLSTPYSLYLDPSSACNFKCNFCPTGHVDLVKESYARRALKMEYFIKVIDGLSQFDKRLKVLRMNKIGEPTLNKNLIEMINYARSSGRVEWIDFSTNGSLLDAKYMLNLKGSGLNRLNVSLEGLTESDYLLNAKVAFHPDQIHSSLKTLREANPDFEVLVKIPGDFVKTEKRRNLFHDLYGGVADYLFVEELADIWPNFNVTNRAGVKEKSVTQYQKPKSYGNACTVILYSMAINSDGTVSACCSDWDQKIIIGDIKKQTLFDIWHGEIHINLIKTHLNGRRNEHNICGSCGHPTNAQVDNIDNDLEIARSKYEKYFESRS